MPDHLMRKVRRVLAQRNLTFRALVIDALEKDIRNESGSFRLRDASVGEKGAKPVDSASINRMIDTQRNAGFRA